MCMMLPLPLTQNGRPRPTAQISLSDPCCAKQLFTAQYAPCMLPILSGLEPGRHLTQSDKLNDRCGGLQLACLPLLGTGASSISLADATFSYLGNKYGSRTLVDEYVGSLINTLAAWQLVRFFLGFPPDASFAIFGMTV